MSSNNLAIQESPNSHLGRKFGIIYELDVEGEHKRLKRRYFEEEVGQLGIGL